VSELLVALPTAAPSADDSADSRATGTLAAVRAEVGFVAVGLACVWWLIIAPRWWGGRGAGAVSGGAILTALAYIAIRPHRYVPRAALFLASFVSLGALVVAVAAPTGWRGAPVAATYVCVAWTVIIVAAATVRDRRFASATAALLAVGVLVEFAESWMAWWGSENPGHPIVGTFYWYNPFAAFMIAGSLLGFALWLRGQRSVRWLGLATCSIGAIGLVYSTSRAAGFCFAVGIVVIALAEIRAQRWDGLRRVAAGGVAMGAAVWLIGGPPFFPHRASPLLGTASRSAGQSLGQNGHYRVEFWREAWGVFTRHPIVGGGYHSMVTLSAGHTPARWALSPLAHNGYLQALSDGGLVLGLPFLAGCAVLGVFAVVLLVRAVRRADVSPVFFVVPLAFLAMLAHSVVDFDWSYAADFQVVAVLGGIVAGMWWAQRVRPADADADQPHPRTALIAKALVATIAVGSLAVAAQTAWSSDLTLTLPVHHSAPHGGS
jgi:O-antigen ligase